MRDFLLAHRNDYESAIAGFRWPAVEKFNWALDWFDPIGRSEKANQKALWVVREDDTETVLSFRELSERSSQVANHFRNLGMNRGERILLMLGNVPQLWESMLAAMKVGAVIVPTTTLLTPGEIADRIGRGGIRYVISSAENANKFADFIERCTCISVGGVVKQWHEYEDGYSCSSHFEPQRETKGSDPLQLYFTSGTTTKPKLVMHSHLSYPVGHLSTMFWLGLQPGDIHLNVSSPGWAKHSWSSFFAPWNAEATIFVFNQIRFKASRLLDVLSRYKITSFCAPPTVWRTLIKEDLANWNVRLREAASAGEPLNPEVIDRVRSTWNITIRDGYGQTETTALVGNSPGQFLKVGSMGRPLPGYEIVLLDSEGHEAAEGEISLRLEPRPIGLMSGYYTEEDDILPLEGKVYRTGDIGVRGTDGYLTFIGRADDVFKSSDYRISPFELESALVQHPDVMECAVVPAPDAIRLSVPKAFVTLRPNIQPSREIALSIFRHIRATLAPFKRIRRIEFADLPKTVSGKIRRGELRQSEMSKSVATSENGLEFREDEFPELR